MLRLYTVAQERKSAKIYEQRHKKIFYSLTKPSERQLLTDD